jgi:predicted ABC-type ATPase
VAAGGHDIPETVIRWRYEAGRRNFHQLYLPLADKWQAYNNSGLSPELVAKGGKGMTISISKPQVWSSITG